MTSLLVVIDNLNVKVEEGLSVLTWNTFSDIDDVEASFLKSSAYGKSAKDQALKRMYVLE